MFDVLKVEKQMEQMNNLNYSENSVSSGSEILDFFVCIKDGVNDFISNFSLERIISSLIVRFDRFHQAVINEFGPNGVYILIVFCFFLVLIAFIYAKSVIDTFRATENANDMSHNGLFYTEQDVENITNADEQDTEQEDFNENTALIEYSEEQDLSQNITQDIADEDTIEDENAQEPVEDEQIYKLPETDLAKKELPHHMIARIEKDEELSEAVIAASSPKTDQITHLSNEYMRLKNIMQKHAEASKIKAQQLESDTVSEDLLEAIRIEENKNIGSLLTLILNLLGRNVSEQKILQIIYQKFSPMFAVNNLLQIFRSIKDFIGLCNSGRLDYIPGRNKLPLNEQALYSLSCGDTTPCLAILQSFLNMEMEKAEQETGVIKEITYAQAANCACIMGNFAYLDDKPLAHNAFELATELSPRNVNAWNRLADLYIEEDSIEKAMIAYQSVLDYGDDVMYPEQMANAQEKLAQYYEKMGMTERAEQYKKMSTDFYHSYGMLSKLTPTEEDALLLIAENSDIRETITVLLPHVANNYSL